MPVNIIVGSQWGDEGKGRATDLMARHATVVARFSGGDNAGHTVIIGENIFKLHLMPSGIVHPNVAALLGNGVVVNPKVLLREMKGLVDRGVEITHDRLKISGKAHIITPAHIALDSAAEGKLGDKKIGTTQRGIGPTYTDKTSRIGIRAQQMANPAEFGEAVFNLVEAKNKILTQIYGLDPLPSREIADEYVGYAEILAPHLVNSVDYLHSKLEAGELILAEGAQGAMLDLDHGTYPFVTSSSPTSSGALIGLGIGPKEVDRIVGISKAFSSRVGSGPFTTELYGDEAVRLRGTGENSWDEFGTTTGRPRRVGWIDLVIVRYASRINSFTELVVTKLDILTGLKEIPVCVAYDYNGTRIDNLPTDPTILAECTPIYEILPGWTEDICGCRDWDKLPENAQNYVTFIAQQVGVDISIVSVGPERDQTIVL